MLQKHITMVDDNLVFVLYKKWKEDKFIIDLVCVKLIILFDTNMFDDDKKFAYFSSV